jgi:nucleotide-binding universal stress UspA family protein
MYQKILVPLDGSELAECSLNHVAGLLNGSAAEVILLNAVVVDMPWREMRMRDSSYAPVFDYASFVNTFVEKSKRYLAKVRTRLTSEGLNVKTETIESNAPSHTIVEYAQRHGVDLIVITTHGHTGMKKMLLGSVATKVLHESHVPVLLIRPEACCV